MYDFRPGIPISAQLCTTIMQNHISTGVFSSCLDIVVFDWNSSFLIGVRATPAFYQCLTQISIRSDHTVLFESRDFTYCMFSMHDKHRYIYNKKMVFWYCWFFTFIFYIFSLPKGSQSYSRLLPAPDTDIDINKVRPPCFESRDANGQGDLFTIWFQYTASI